jgi:hypothetical protein
MKFVVDFAMKKLPAGNPNKIRGQLQRIVRSYDKGSTYNVRSKTRIANVWRGTMAARVIFKLNWQDARLDAAFGDTEGYYKKASLFTRNRVYAAGFHRSGLREAAAALKVTKGGRLPRFKEQPGRYGETLSEQVTGLLVETWARAAGVKAKDPTQLYPDLFERVFPEANKLLEGFLAKDMQTAAAKEGFTVKAAA